MAKNKTPSTCFDFQKDWLMAHGRFIPLLIALMLPLPCLVAMDVILINATSSMPRGVWRVKALTPSSELVSLTPPEQAIAWRCVRPSQVLIKRVWAREGEEVCAHGRVLYKASAPERVVKTSLLSTHGELLELGWKGCHTLKKGEVFVIGQHPSSCDSRFFGTVPTSSLKSEVVPWLILDDMQEAP